MDGQNPVTFSPITPGGTDNSQQAQTNPSSNQPSGLVTFSPITPGSSPDLTTSAPTDQNKVSTGVYETAIKPVVDTAKQVVSKPIDLYHEAVDAYKSGDWKTGTEKASRLLTILPMFPGTNYEALADAAKQLVMQPINEIEHGYKQKKDQGASTGQAVVQTATHALPVVGPIMANAEDIINKHLNAKEYKAAAGNFLGTLATLGLSTMGEPEEAAVNDVNENVVRPGVKNIAGVDVPVATPNSATQGTLSRTVQKGATAAGAQHFIDNYTQPATLRANVGNIGNAVMNSADEIRTLRGDPLTAQNPPHIQSVDDAADFLKKEAKPTYETLDKAAQPEIQSWQKAKDSWDRQNPQPTKPAQGPTPFTGTKPTATQNAATKASYQAKLQDWKDAENDWLENNPKPKTFTEMQDQLTNAKDTLDSKFASQVDKEAAKKNLPTYQREMDDFLNRHSNVVDPKELATANKLWGQSKQMEWLADKVRTATTGTTGTPSVGLKQSPLNLNREQLMHLPGQFDNQFGKGSWESTLGPEGVKNYNAIVDALKNPISGEMPLNLFLHEHWLGTYLKGASLTGPIANTILFNPEAGQALLKLWKNAPRMAARAAVVGQAAQPRPNNQLKQALTGATGLAGGEIPKDNGSTNGTRAPQNNVPSGAGYPVPVVPGNISWYNRPSVPDPYRSGYYGTVHSASREENGLEVLYPQVYDGKWHTDAQAWEHYKKTGEHMGKFKNANDATKYSLKYHVDAANGKFGYAPIVPGQ